MLTPKQRFTGKQDVFKLDAEAIQVPILRQGYDLHNRCESYRCQSYRPILQANPTGQSYRPILQVLQVPILRQRYDLHESGGETSPCDAC
ncbi:hypothetical protein DUNSADRAFT_6554 [Dunaliella salina]|uniref:Encoded protein n=1 Tax=Dunaliella salina TaxID=3046 RepID=A0ABQ7GN59_DUNSA|nr:hypothetical protein DUNSADRAFT_6554 [Dunaliella salina]|eukprot:KAF5836033.1 hypothetical protein DUNSADRAFT_6554 [Dunaliella salina]